MPNSSVSHSISKKIRTSFAGQTSQKAVETITYPPAELKSNLSLSKPKFPDPTQPKHPIIADISGNVLPPKKNNFKQLVFGIAIFVLLLGGGVTAFLLSRQTADLRQQAAEETSDIVYIDGVKCDGITVDYNCSNKCVVKSASLVSNEGNHAKIQWDLDLVGSISGGSYQVSVGNSQCGWVKATAAAGSHDLTVDYSGKSADELAKCAGNQYVWNVDCHIEGPAPENKYLAQCSAKTIGQSEPTPTVVLDKACWEVGNLCNIASVTVAQNTEDPAYSLKIGWQTTGTGVGSSDYAISYGWCDATADGEACQPKTWLAGGKPAASGNAQIDYLKPNTKYRVTVGCFLNNATNDQRYCSDKTASASTSACEECTTPTPTPTSVTTPTVTATVTATVTPTATASPTTTNTPGPTATPTITPTPVIGCNEVCVTNADCANPDHICYTVDNVNRCRLASNPTDQSCQVAATATPTPQTITTTQPALPVSLPSTGPEDWDSWLQAGLAVTGIGVALLLML